MTKPLYLSEAPGYVSDSFIPGGGPRFTIALSKDIHLTGCRSLRLR